MNLKSTNIALAVWRGLQSPHNLGLDEVESWDLNLREC
jgi:hypothetical protein